MPSRVIGDPTHHTGSLERGRRLLARSGPRGLVAAVANRLIAPIARLAAPGLTHRRLAAFAAARAPATPIVMVSTLDWGFPYLQRPHHLARALADAGRPVVFVTPAQGADRVFATRHVAPNLIVTPHLAAAVQAIAAPTVYLLSTDGRLRDEVVDQVAGRGGHIVYDYIDAMHDAVSNAPITAERLRLHDRLLADTRLCTCIVSATHLLRVVSAVRPAGFALVTNGVNVAHFSAARSRAGLRDDFAAIVGRGRPIAGYFGALAAWLDYALVLDVAARRPDVEFVMMGPDYDGSVRALDRRPENLHVLAPIDYARLPAHAVWFDVATMPFGLNEITEATSPLKLFEYFALGLPVVSTPIAEAAAYPVVLLGKIGVEWSAALDRALAVRGDAGYRAQLADAARANDWRAKAAAIIALLG